MNLSVSPASLDVSTSNSGVHTSYATILPAARRRGERYLVAWSQLAGIPGVVSDPTSPTTRFSFFTGGSAGAYPVAFRCDLVNQFGDLGSLDLRFTVTKYDPEPDPMVGVGAPALERVVLPPGVYSYNCSFSISVSGGVPPYNFNWGGGVSPTSPSNSAVISFTPGSGGTTFGPGCTVTDSAGSSITVGGILFEIIEGS